MVRTSRKKTSPIQPKILAIETYFLRRFFLFLLVVFFLLAVALAGFLDWVSAGVDSVAFSVGFSGAFVNLGLGAGAGRLVALPPFLFLP